MSNVTLSRNCHVQPPESKWRQQHEDFQKIAADLKSNPKKPEDKYRVSKLDFGLGTRTSMPMIQCPYCKRKFSNAVAERHVAACKNMAHNKSSSKPSTPKKQQLSLTGKK